MVEMSLVMPRFIREYSGLLNKILQLEQQGEHLHAIFNRSENKYKSTKMLVDYENKLSKL